MAYCISAAHHETGDGVARVYGPYEEEGLAEADWLRFGGPLYGVLPLREPPENNWVPKWKEQRFEQEPPQIEFSVLVREADEGGYWTEVSGLPGAGSQGATVEEAVTNTRESIEGVMRVMRERGEAIPAMRSSEIRSPQVSRAPEPRT